MAIFLRFFIHILYWSGKNRIAAHTEKIARLERLLAAKGN